MSDGGYRKYVALLAEHGAAMHSALRAISARIDQASGSPSFTAAEHDDILALLAKLGEPVAKPRRQAV